MTIGTSRVTVHMVSSLDGFIAKKDNDVSWLQSTDNYEQGHTLTDAEIKKFIDSIDCYVMGAKTYETALQLGWPYGDKPVIVLTNKNRISDRAKVEFYSGQLEKLVNGRLKKAYKNIWLVGGAAVVKEFIRLNLVDEIVMSIMPVILGDGTLFFDYIGREYKLHLKDMKAYKDGMVELCYEINNNKNKNELV